jgi:hypothetical protein
MDAGICNGWDADLDSESDWAGAYRHIHTAVVRQLARKSTDCQDRDGPALRGCIGIGTL